jgi:hypothetical protein
MMKSGPHVRTGQPDIARHRMAVDQDGEPEAGMGAGDQLAKAGVIGLVDRFDTRHRLVDRQPAAIDFHVFRDDPGDRAEPACDPHRADIDERRQRPVEHARIELVGLAVDVEIGAREMGEKQRRTEFRRIGEKLVDIVVCGAADGERIEVALGEKFGRVEAAAVRRIEDEGDSLRGGLPHFEVFKITRVAIHPAFTMSRTCSGTHVASCPRRSPYYLYPTKSSCTLIKRMFTACRQCKRYRQL